MPYNPNFGEMDFDENVFMFFFCVVAKSDIIFTDINFFSISHATLQFAYRNVPKYIESLWEWKTAHPHGAQNQHPNTHIFIGEWRLQCIYQYIKADFTTIYTSQIKEEKKNDNCGKFP